MLFGNGAVARTDFPSFELATSFLCQRQRLPVIKHSKFDIVAVFPFRESHVSCLLFVGPVSRITALRIRRVHLPSVARCLTVDWPPPIQFWTVWPPPREHGVPTLSNSPPFVF